MAEQLANDPSFQAMASQLQKQQQGGQESATPSIDPEAYTSAMQNLMNNPQFMQVAEKLGSEMMQVRPRATSEIDSQRHETRPTEGRTNKTKTTRKDGRRKRHVARASLHATTSIRPLVVRRLADVD